MGITTEKILIETAIQLGAVCQQTKSGLFKFIWNHGLYTTFIAFDETTGNLVCSHREKLINETFTQIANKLMAEYGLSAE